MKLLFISVISALILLNILAINSQVLGDGYKILTVSALKLNKSQSPNPIPTVTPSTNSFIGVDAIELDKDRVHIPCEPGARPNEREDCSDDMTINVITVTSSLKAASEYNYTTSGGRVIGRGANVIWDLTGLRPGTYEITVGISGSDKTQTKKISVLECDCGGDCSCPILSVLEPTSATRAGEIMTFMAKIEGGSVDDFTYEWIVSSGDIIEGQGTPVIKVATNSKMAGNLVEATFTTSWKGVCSEICIRSASGNGSVASEKGKKNKTRRKITRN